MKRYVVMVSIASLILAGLHAGAAEKASVKFPSISAKSIDLIQLSDKDGAGTLFRFNEPVLQVEKNAELKAIEATSFLSSAGAATMTIDMKVGVITWKDGSQKPMFLTNAHATYDTKTGKFDIGADQIYSDEPFRPLPNVKADVQKIGSVERGNSGRDAMASNR